MSTYGTPFAESEALLAVQAGDVETAERVLRGMLPRELDELAAAATELGHMARSMRRIKLREALDAGDGGGS